MNITAELALPLKSEKKCPNYEVHFTPSFRSFILCEYS